MLVIHPAGQPSSADAHATLTVVTCNLSRLLLYVYSVAPTLQHLRGYIQV
jgi:hypothetical protein